MNRTRLTFAVSFGVALAAACGGSTSKNGASDGGGGNSSGGGGSSGASSSSSSSGGVFVDGGIACGQTSCISPQVCCYATATGAEAGAGGFAMPTGSCADSCPDGGVEIGCMNASNCQNSEVCCGTGGAGAGAFSVACSAQCSGTESFQLCASDSECLNGGMCVGLGTKICLPDGGFPVPEGGYPFPEGGFMRPDAGNGTSDAGSTAQSD